MTSWGGTNNDGTIFKIKADGSEFTKLLNFDFTISGSKPLGTLISDGTFLYGMTNLGGSAGVGVIFKIKSDGTGFAKLNDFDGTYNGGLPQASLISDGTFLYGTTNVGGSYGMGVIFKIKPDGTDFTIMLDFNSIPNGEEPHGSLIFDGSFLYGTTYQGGVNGYGTLFKIQSDGTAFAKLLDFNSRINGMYPQGSLISDGTFLYGMTALGGANNDGTIFKVKPDGTSYTKLQDFNGTTTGKAPLGSLISDGTFLYGMTSIGGINDGGTLFKVKSDGSAYAKLLDFDCEPTGTGCLPQGSLISDGVFLYGMTFGGGLNGFGTIFKIKPDGTAYTKLLDFNDTTTGKYPWGSLFSDGVFLYGMTEGGGNGINLWGTIFKIKPDGTMFTKLLDFDETITGGNPFGSFISDGTYLYGTTSNGGANFVGTIFKIKPDGTAFTKLLDFDRPITGGRPYGSLVSDGTYLYGMAQDGGSMASCFLGCGTIFKIKSDGTEVTKLLNFDNATTGSYPRGSLIYDGTFLYGTTENGAGGYGTLFKMTPTLPPCNANYTTTYDTTLNIFTLVVDSATIANATAYSWDFGDGTTSTLAIPPHTYPVGGTYNVCMKIYRPYGDSCSYCQLLTGNDNFTINDTLSSCIANYITSYNSTLDNFTLTVDSATTANAISYNWDFGDGVSSTDTIPTHTFVTPGSYNVCMKIYTASGDSCSYCQMITGDAGFTINIPDTTVIPSCIANYTTDYDSSLNTFILNVDSATTALATSYHWDFGDGSTSILATPSHVYTVDSLYNVCMKVVYADGDSCAYCHTIGIDSAGNIIRDAGFTLNVHNATTGISENVNNQITVTIYPNPTTGIFQLAMGNGQLTSAATLSIYNVVGEKIYMKDGKQLNASTTIDLSDQPNGIYFMQLKTEASTITKKIIINK